MLTACSPVYKLAINQGNVIDDKKLAQLHPGMSAEQVRFLMGSPLLNDEFSPARWDYSAYYRGPDGQEQRRTVTLMFADGVLASIADSRPPSSAQPEEEPALPDADAPDVPPVVDTPPESV